MGWAPPGSELTSRCQQILTHLSNVSVIVVIHAGSIGARRSRGGSLHAYLLAKRGYSLRAMAEAVRWGKRGGRVNTISPGIIITPLAKDELSGPRGAGYRRMIHPEMHSRQSLGASRS